MKRLLLVVLLLSGLSACGSQQSAYPNVGPGIRDGHARAILGRASFEMNCPQDQITLVKVAHWQVGASGCGQRGLYVYDGNNGSWILNSTSKPF